MPRKSKRDFVWNAALSKTHRAGKAIDPGEMADDLQASERMVRDTLNVMAEYGWLRRDVKMDNSVRFLPPEDADSAL